MQVTHMQIIFKLVGVASGRCAHPQPPPPISIQLPSLSMSLSRTFSCPFPGLSVYLFEDCQCFFSRRGSFHVLKLSVFHSPGCQCSFSKTVSIFQDCHCSFAKTVNVPWWPVINFCPRLPALLLKAHWFSFPGMSMFLLHDSYCSISRTFSFTAPGLLVFLFQ